MARPVTVDRTSARASFARCLSLHPAIICPGHREPLITGVEDACATMRGRLDANCPWPLQWLTPANRRYRWASICFWRTSCDPSVLHQRHIGRVLRSS
jgi:hypothetical protein